MNFEDLIQEDDLLITPPTNDAPPTGDDTPPDNQDDTPPSIDPPQTDDDIDEKDEVSESYFNFLKEFNVLDLPDDFEFTGKPEQLEQALQVTKENMQNKIAEALWNKLPEDFRPLLEYGLKGGNSLDSYLKAFAAPVDYESIEIETPEDQKKIIFESFKVTSKHDDERILKIIKSLEVSGDLEEAAKEAKEDLISFQATRKASFLEEQKKEQEKQAAQYEEFKNSVTASVDKTAHDSLRKNRIKQVLFSPIKVGDRTATEFDTNLDAILDNPEHLVQLADILADYNPKVGFNFDRIKKQLKSESTTTFKQLIQEKLDTKSKVGSSSSKQVIDESKIWQDNFDY